MGKYLQFFSQQYGCEAMAQGSEEAKGSNIVVQGTCPCSSSSTCRFTHTIDPQGNVIESKEEGCPCPSSASSNPYAPRGEIIKSEKPGKSKGQKVGQAIAITVSVVSAIIIIIGIVFIAKRAKHGGKK